MMAASTYDQSPPKKNGTRWKTSGAPCRRGCEKLHLRRTIDSAISDLCCGTGRRAGRASAITMTITNVPITIKYLFYHYSYYCCYHNHYYYYGCYYSSYTFITIAILILLLLFLSLLLFLFLCSCVQQVNRTIAQALPFMRGPLKGT